MLGKVDLSQKVSKTEYKEEKKVLSERLTSAVQKAKELKIPVLIVFEGWSAAGKGTLIKKVLYPLDPRDFYVRTMSKVNEDMVMRPYLWRYWKDTPLKGEIAIFDKSWHRLLYDDKVNLSEKERENFYKDVISFERQLSDDGTALIKFFLHIGKDEQAKRFKELLSKDGTKWRVDKADIEQNENYDEQLKLHSSMILNTNSGFAPWYVIESNDRYYATLKVYRLLINRLEAEIEKKLKSSGEASTKTAPEPIVKILKSVDMSKTIEKDAYKKKLDKLQSKIGDLGYELYSKRMSVIIVYEGWDAAGKGGNIKRLTERLDPRGYIVEPVAKPTPDELNHHYLWRFWSKIPKDGHITIFDRSWYGRVMVERIEGFCTESEYKRAYSEINNMEMQIVGHGTPIIKFWLNIDKEEQLKRFQERESNPLKSYKMTDEDWRNREKWDLYEDAIDEMLFRTSTDYAPWHIIESNCKMFARIKALEIAVETIERSLKEKTKKGRRG